MRKRYKGFSLIEIAVVIAIIGILLTVGMGLWKQAYRYLKFKKYIEGFRERKELLLEGVDSPFHLKRVYETGVKESFPFSRLILSQAFLRTFPDPCFYFPEVSAVEDAPFLTFRRLKGKRVEEFVVPFFYLESGPDRKFQFDFDGEKKVVIRVGPKFDDRYLAPSIPLLRSRRKCPLLPKVSIDAVIPEERITERERIVYRIIYPRGYKLVISSPVEVKELAEHRKRVNLLLQPGINMLDFILFKDGEEVYRRKDYVALFRAPNPDCELKAFGLVFPEAQSEPPFSAPLRVKLRWDFPCANTYRCLVDFGDGDYVYLPDCGSVPISHTFSHRGRFEVRLFIDDGRYSYSARQEIEIEEGNEKPEIKIEANLKKIWKGRKSKEVFTLFVKVKDEEKCACRLYYNSRLLTQNDNCQKLSLNMHEESFEHIPIKLVVEDEFSAKTVLNAYAEEWPWLTGVQN